MGLGLSSYRTVKMKRTTKSRFRDLRGKSESVFVETSSDVQFVRNAGNSNASDSCDGSGPENALGEDSALDLLVLGAHRVMSPMRSRK